MTVTRFAPSPTGLLHVGNLRTALMNWLIARKAGGVFLLRIDDTDAERSEEHFVDAIRRDLEWLGLTWDREERQSTRADRYAEATAQLRTAARAYECFETPLELELKRKKQLAMGRPPVYDRAALVLTNAEREELRASRNPHLRFLLEHQEIRWDDLIRGLQKVDAASISDPVLIKADGQLLYTLASVVDDADFGVTHIVRGADHVTNTGAQIQIFKALGARAPAFAHHSLLTGPGGESLSKRLGSLSLTELRESGVEPMAVLAFLARLGSSQPIDVVTTTDALIEGFDISSFGLAPTRFDPEELWLHSAKTLRALPFEAVAERLAVQGVPAEARAAFWTAIGPNLNRMTEAADWWRICASGPGGAPPPEDADFVEQAFALLPPKPWNGETWSQWTAEVRRATGRKGRGLFLPLRRALTGRDHGPDMAALMPLITGPRQRA